MKLVKNFLACVLALTAVGTATATLDDQMRKSFDGLVNITPSGQYQGQTRGVITGGNVYVRNRIVNPSIINFRAPSIKAGCGGIDIYKGSIGFISKAEFEALLQAIASNARGYAFQLALDIVCPTCAANMKELQDKIQKLTQGSINSCEIGKGLINRFTPLKQMADESVKESGRKASSMWGIFDNFFEGSFMNKVGGEQRDARAHLTATEKEQAEIEGNIVWKAVVGNSVADWYAYGGGTTDFYEIMMDLSGTIVITNTKTGPETTDTDIKSFPGNISMKDFLHGTSSTKALKCDTIDENGCLAPYYDTVVIEGMEKKIDRMLMGGGGSIGIIAKLRDKASASTFTVEEKLFIEAASPGILGLLRDFAYDTRAAKAVADIFKQTLAQEMTISFINEMMRTVRSAVINSKEMGGLREKTQELLDKSSEKIDSARMNSSMTLSGISQAFLVASYMRQNIKSRIDAERDPLNVK